MAKLYYWFAVAFWTFAAITFLLVYWLAAMLEHDPEKEQARLTEFGE